MPVLLKELIRYRVINPACNKILSVIYRNTGTYVLNEDWNNLIILDACRYDVFKEVNTIEGILEYRISRGTSTPEFLEENFNGRFSLRDIVYITANPWVQKLCRGKFKIINVWAEGWDYELGTVPPSTVYDYAVDAIQKYPEKRVIIHFMQPHLPFVNKNTCRAFNQEVKRILGLDIDVSTLIKVGENPLTYRNRAVKKLLIDGYKIEGIRDIMIKGYRENLKLTLPYVEKLVGLLSGRTVVTSDHGEAFGEKLHPLIPLKIYSHREKTRIDSLVKVPWLIVDADGEHVFTEEEEAKIRERLMALGYM